MSQIFFTRFRRTLTRGSAALILPALFILLGFQTSAAQMIRHTEYQADHSLKSNARVNPSTLAMELSIPLAVYKGRAGNHLPVSFNYSSKVWQIKPTGSIVNQHGIITDTRPMFGLKTAAGWTSNLAAPLIDFFPTRYTGFRQSSPYEGTPYELSALEEPSSDPLYYVKRLHVVMPGGDSHEFRVDDTVRDCGSIQAMCDPDIYGTYLSVDGTRMRLEITEQSRVLLLPDGSRYLFGQNGTLATTYIDAHGNQMTYDAANRRWTDTLGRTINDPLNPNWGDFQQNQTVGDQTVPFPGISGDLNVILSWRYLKDPNNPTASGASGLENVSDTLHSLSNTGCNGNGYSTVTGPYLFTSPETNRARVCQPGSGTLGGWTQGPPFNPIVLTKITLANNQFYEFKYNVYGEITKIIYPTGGYEEFTYGFIPTLQGNEDTYSQANRGVTSRRVSVKGDGTDEIEWTYQIGSPYKIITTAPDTSRTEQYLYSEPIVPPVAYGFIRERTGRSYEDRVYAAGSPGQLMKRSFTKYASTGAQSGGYTNATRDLRTEKQISITFEPGETNALAQLVETVYETPGQPGVPGDAGYFAAQNVRQQKIYHYVSISASVASSNATDIDTALDWFTSASPATITETDYLYDANYKARNISGLATETRIKDASGNVKAKAQIVYDEAARLEVVSVFNAPGWTNPGTSYRGLPTTTKSWSDIANNQFIQTHASYDQFGNPRKSWDGRDNYTETIYTDNYTDNTNRNSYALPTATISYAGANGTGTQFTSSIKYDFNTGLIRYTTDANNQTSEMQYNDALLRPTKAIAPNGHQTITEYGAGTTESTRFVKVKTQIDEQKWKEGYTFYDGLGKTVKTQSVDSTGDVFALTCYDIYGRVQKVSNPFRNVSNATCASSLEWTTTMYDAAGRAWKMTTPDNAVVETNYSLATIGTHLGTAVTVKDQALKERRSITNALGQLTRVDEPTDANGLGAIAAPNQPTYYEYDLLNNLTKVKQGGTLSSPEQTRNFDYDSLSRLKSATNPESGTILYGYDENGNLSNKLDARNVKTNYVYDALNRVTSRSYTNSTGGLLPDKLATPTVGYIYDNLINAKGKLTKVTTTGTNGSTFSAVTDYQQFDQMGRVTQSQQTIEGVTYGTSPQIYVYNLSGALVEQTYPSGRVVKNVLDNEGDLSLVQSKRNGNYGFWNYAKSFTYTAAGAVSSMQLGNGRWESTQFNSRLQPTQIALGSVQNGTDKLKLNYTYHTTTNNVANADNNGNVLSQTITVPTETRNSTTYAGFTATQNYTYDSLNRLKSAEETIPGQTGWKQTFKYDRYGNRNFDYGANPSNPDTTTPNAQSTTPKVVNPEVLTTNNRFKQDQDNDSIPDYLYDAAGNTTQDANNKNFTYDAENKQTKVETVNSSGTVTGTLGTYFYDGDGKRVKKVSATETVIFIYDAGGKLVAEYANQTATTPQVSYLTSDNLGSPRINTDQNGQVISRHDYQPFGEEIYSISGNTARTGYNVDEVRKQFTSYERDIESDLDFAQARMYANKLGRFTSVDPLLSSGRLENPQTWNRYSYTLNNPLIYTDPTGAYVFTDALGGATSDEDLITNAGTDKKKLKAANKIIEQRHKIRDAMVKAKEAGAKSDNPDAVNKAVDAYGGYLTANGVVVGFGDTGGDPGLTRGVKDANGALFSFADGKFTANILVLFKESAGEEDFINAVAHEGQHVADRQAVADVITANVNDSNFDFHNSSANVTHRTTEERAYLVTAMVAQGRGQTSWSPAGYEIWNSSWKAAERMDKISKGINKLLTGSKTYNKKLDERIYPK